VKVTIELDNVLSDDQQREITSLLGTVADPVAAFCRAAVAESADAILTRRPEPALSTQYRLHRLIKHAFNGTIPSEEVVSRIFGITERRAITMISTVAKRYQSDFESGWAAAVADAFKNKDTSKDADGPFYRFAAPSAVIDFLRETIGGLNEGKLAPVQRAKGTAERYEIRKDTYDAVCKKLGLKEAAEP
jgi:hypothetical protein